jgi:hypothetical protein
MAERSKDFQINWSFNFAIYLLMDNYQDADMIFESLSERDQALIQDYPIWHFYHRHRYGCTL